MIELFFAILIALGCDISSGKTADQLKAEDPASYEAARQIVDSENYRTTDGGGIITWE